MVQFRLFSLAALVLAVASLVGPAGGLAQQVAHADSADRLFTGGSFPEADRAYQASWAADTSDYSAALRLGTIALVGNRLERAAELNRALGRTAVADKLASFAGRTPYELAGPDRVDLPFVQADPLPVVTVRVNGGDEVFFLIDTGASEVYLDSEFATEVGAARFGSGTGTFGGDRQAAVEQGRIDSLALGPLVVKHVPVHILPTRRFAAAGGGRRIDGILGTNPFYHFLPTLDYPGRSLILRRRTPEQLRALETQASTGGHIVVPFWLAGDGFYGPFPASLEQTFGFRIGGVISHTFFKGYAVTFDFDGMRLFLAPAGQ